MSEHTPYEKPTSDHQYGVNYGARRVRVFVDKTDWDCEVGYAAGGNRVYPSIEDLKTRRACVDECGIVEVEITLVRVVQERKL